MNNEAQHRFLLIAGTILAVSNCCLSMRFADNQEQKQAYAVLLIASIVIGVAGYSQL